MQITISGLNFRTLNFMNQPIIKYPKLLIQQIGKRIYKKILETSVINSPNAMCTFREQREDRPSKIIK